MNVKKSQLRLVANNNVISGDPGPPFQFDLLVVTAAYVNSQRVSLKIKELHNYILRCSPSCPVCQGQCSFRRIAADETVNWLQFQKRIIRDTKKYNENNYDWPQELQKFFEKFEIAPEGEKVRISAKLFYRREYGSVWATVEVRHTD